MICYWLLRTMMNAHSIAYSMSITSNWAVLFSPLPAQKNLPKRFIITRNHTLNTIRKQVQEKEKQQQLAQHYEQAEEAEMVGEDNRYALLDSAVDQLPQQQRKVYLLRQQGLKNADVAYELDLSVNSVKKYQQWAMQTIVKLIKAGPFTGLIIISSRFF